MAKSKSTLLKPSINTKNTDRPAKRRRKRKARTEVSSSDDDDGDESSESSVDEEERGREKRVKRKRERTENNGKAEGKSSREGDGGSDEGDVRPSGGDAVRPKGILKMSRATEASKIEIPADADSDSDSSDSDPESSSASDASASSSSSSSSEDEEHATALFPKTTNHPPATHLFADYYLRAVTAEFAEDLEKLRQAADFKDHSLDVLVSGLRQGVSGFSVEERERIGKAIGEADA